MDNSVDHILLTRFNLPSEGAESTIRSRDGWLKARVDLFARYCMPSVAAQRGANSKWLVYFDPASPQWLMSWIESTCQDNYQPVFRATVDHSSLLEDIDGLFPKKAESLITSNLDNDDGLSVNFTARLQALRRSAPTSAIYFSNGLIKSGSRLYLRTDRENAFCSVRESWDDPTTCWADWHNRLHLRMPVEVVGGEPQWLQVIHGTNVSNRVRGRLASPTPYRNEFVGLDDVLSPGRVEMWGDRMTRMPVREARDGARTVVRRTAVALLGKDGVNRIKARLAGADSNLTVNHRPGRRPL